MIMQGQAKAKARAVTPDVRGLGRMSGAWEMILAPSIGSPHPWTWGLAHLWEGPLGA